VSNWKDKLGEAHQLMEDIKALQANEEATAEDKAKIPEMLKDANMLRAEAGQLKEIEMSALELEQEMRAVTEPDPEPEVEKHETKDGNGPSEFNIKDRRIHGSDFKDGGEFLYASWLASIGRKRDPRLAYFREKDESPGHEKKQMVESVGASGGFLVPTEYLAQLQAVGPGDAIVRPRATKIRMRRRAIDIPVLNQTGTTAGIPHWYGGMIFYWAEEASEKTLTTASFKKVTLVAHKLIGYTRASDELLDDAAISLSDFISGPMGFVGGCTWHEDYTFLQGTGAGQPLGVINAGATITVNRAGANAISYADLVNMLEAFLPSANGVWVANQSVMSNLMTMQDASGGAAGTGSYIWGSAADGVPARLLGLPIIFTEKVPRIGTAGDIGLYDFKYYLLGDRQATTVESTKFDKWAYDQTSWRVVHRVDGQPWLSTYLTYQDGTTTVNDPCPYVL
jgi:HK97 family phage major capsid protein